MRQVNELASHQEERHSKLLTERRSAKVNSCGIEETTVASKKTVDQSMQILAGHIAHIVCQKFPSKPGKRETTTPEVGQGLAGEMQASYQCNGCGKFSETLRRCCVVRVANSLFTVA